MVQLFLGERQPVTCFVDNEILCWPWLPNLLMHTHIYSGFPGDTSGKEPASQFQRGKRCGFNPWVRKIWRRNWLPTPVFLPGKSHGQRSLAGYSPRGPKESDRTEGLHFHFHFQLKGGVADNIRTCTPLISSRVSFLMSSSGAFCLALGGLCYGEY